MQAARSACASSPRAGRWISASRRRAAARLGGGGGGCRARCDRGGGRAAARARAGRDGAGRGRSLLAVLGDEAADGRLGEAGRRLGLQLHASGRDGGGRGLLPGSVRLLAGRVPRRAGWTAPDVWCALRPSLAGGRADVRVGRGQRCTLSHVQPAAGSGRSAGEGAGRRRRAGGAGRRRLGVERALRPLLRRQAGAARRARPRRAGGDDVPRGAATRHARRRCGARAGRHRLDRGGQVRRSGGPGAPTASSSAAPRIAWPGSCCRRRIASTGCSSGARTSSATATSSGPKRTRSPASTARRQAVLPLRDMAVPGTELCQFSDNSFTGAVDSRRVQGSRRDRRQPEKRIGFAVARRLLAAGNGVLIHSWAAGDENPTPAGCRRCSPSWSKRAAWRMSRPISRIPRLLQPSSVRRRTRSVTSTSSSSTIRSEGALAELTADDIDAQLQVNIRRRCCS